MTLVGASVSLFDKTNLGASLSVRAFARLGSGASFSSMYRAGTVAFQSSETYITETSAGLQFYVSGARAMNAESDGGYFHGTWTIESSFNSDRRLKKNIMPLHRTLREVIASRAGHTVDFDAKSGDRKMNDIETRDADGASWMLRQLRPVSYSFRKGAESKFMRFGFIADELESVVPEVVRRPGDREVTDQKAKSVKAASSTNATNASNATNLTNGTNSTVV